MIKNYIIFSWFFQKNEHNEIVIEKHSITFYLFDKKKKMTVKELRQKLFELENQDMEIKIAYFNWIFKNFSEIKQVSEILGENKTEFYTITNY